jgi:hypothetical protein
MTLAAREARIADFNRSLPAADRRGYRRPQKPSPRGKRCPPTQSILPRNRYLKLDHPALNAPHSVLPSPPRAGPLDRGWIITQVNGQRELLGSGARQAGPLARGGARRACAFGQTPTATRLRIYAIRFTHTG